MNKLILLLSLTYINVYANKNWININTNDGYALKTYNSSSSFRKVNKSRPQTSNKGQRIKLIDTRLLKSIRNVQSLVREYKR